MPAERVVVAGGGVAGLVAARRLADAGASVTVFERESTVGGRVRSTRRDGFVFDRGFQILPTASPAARHHLRLDDLDLRAFSPGATVCRPNHRGTLADPLRKPALAVETALTRDVTLGDKLRVLRLRRDLARRSLDEVFAGPDQSIREALRDRGFSGRFVSNLAAPLYGGVTLDRSLSTSRKVFDATFKLFAAGDIAVPATGMQAVPDQLAAAARDVGATVETDAEVTAVRCDEESAVEVSGETVTADAVVVATDPRTAREFTGVDAIPTDGRGCVTQFYRLPADAWPDTGGRLLLNADDTGPNHVAPMSEVAPEHAPDGTALVSATYLGDPDATDDDLGARTYSALAAWFPERSFADLRAVHTERVPFAQFPQPPGVYETLPDARAPGGRVYLAGDYTRWSSLDGAMASGRNAAKAVLEDL
jgi:phytoene dehydrogenase-like protein